MIIIAESGATKTDWRSITSKGICHSLKTAGMNVATESQDFIQETLRGAIPLLNPEGEQVSRIHFYAAGLISSGDAVPESAVKLDNELKIAFPGAVIEYASDLLDAARAVCGHAPGIAAIMGTGSNSCLYDGKEIVKNIHSSGYILGDEGGAACLGKLFMSDFLKGLVPEPLSTEFANAFKVDYLTVVNNVYKSAAPSKYLGSFAPFIVDHYGKVPYVTDLVENNFRQLIIRCLKQYDIERYPVGVVGGFGYAYKDILKKVGAEYGIRFSEITASPIEGLVKYHKDEIHL
ncbi:MAG: ATPase [Bacteroidales bacterium]|jgi:N-acetylglucosamine kinase-like BadF-type ATPase|nr:ATPase [Bacteroidales bacterium]MCI1785069.1 ATPase [Bacteroidales bacterium]